MKGRWTRVQFPAAPQQEDPPDVRGVFLLYCRAVRVYHPCGSTTVGVVFLAGLVGRAGMSLRLGCDRIWVS